MAGLLAEIFAGTIVVESTQFTATVVPVQIINNNPNRYAVGISNGDAALCYISSIPNPTAQQGWFLNQGDVVWWTVKDQGPLVLGPLWAHDAGIGTLLTIFEIIIPKGA